MTQLCPVCSTSVPLKDGVIPRHKRDGERCPGGETTQHAPLPWSKPITQNQLRRMHPMAEARLKRQMSDDARWLIRSAKLTPVQRAEVTLHYRPGTRRPCDADGLAPTLKIALDALVREGVLPDDDYRHVPRVGIEIHEPRDGMPASFWIEIESVEEGRHDRARG